MKYVETNRSVAHSVSYGGAQGTPYVTSSSENVFGQWTIIWERYVPEENE